MQLKQLLLLLLFLQLWLMSLLAVVVAYSMGITGERIVLAVILSVLVVAAIAADVVTGLI